MSSSLGDVIVNLRAHDVNMTSGFNRLGHHLEEIGSKLTSFHGLMHIVVGFGVGRALFHHIHEGLMHLGEGFIEGGREGLGFFGAIWSGTGKMLGFKTALDDITEAHKRSAEAAKMHEAELNRLSDWQAHYARTKQEADDEISGKKREVVMNEGTIDEYRTEVDDKGAAHIKKFESQRDSLDDESRKVIQEMTALTRKVEHHEMTSKESAAQQVELNKKLADIKKQRIQVNRDIYNAEQAAVAETKREADAKDQKARDDVEREADNELRHKVDSEEKAARAEEERKAKQEDDKRERDYQQGLKEAKAVRDESDPQAALRDKAEHAQGLYNSGFLSPEERDKEFDHLRKHFGGLEGEEKKHTQAKFYSADKFAEHIQESLNKDDTPKKQLVSLQSIDKTLLEIKGSKQLAVLG